MRIHFESNKFKSIIWDFFAIIILITLAIMDVALINMFQVHITFAMKILTGFVWLFFIFGFILRLIKLRKITLAFILIADAILIFIMFYQDGNMFNSLQEMFNEPTFILNILIISILVLDWKIRFGRLNDMLKLESKNHEHNNRLHLL